MKARALPRCRRCGGTCVDFDGEGAACLMCGRPSVAPRPALHLITEDTALIDRAIKREARVIERDRAAGRRSWA